MKTSNEWIRDIHEKADKRFAEQKRKRKIIAEISSLTVCLALVLCSVFAMPGLIGNNGLTVVESEGSGTNQTLDNAHNISADHPNHSDDPVISAPDFVDSSKNPSVDTPSNMPSGSQNDDPAVKKLFSANKIISRISGAPKYRDPGDHHKELWTQTQITEYFGVDLTALSPYMSADLTYSQNYDFEILFHNSGEIVEDHQTFVYSGRNNRKVEVLVSRIATPYDSIYELETSSKTPVGDIEVLFGVKPNSKDFSKYDFIYADFEAGGLYYRVEADNLTPNEFYEIVKGITRLK